MKKQLYSLMEKANELRVALDLSPVTHGFADEREALHVAILDAREALGLPVEEPKPIIVTRQTLKMFTHKRAKSKREMAD